MLRDTIQPFPTLLGDLRRRAEGAARRDRGGRGGGGASALDGQTVVVIGGSSGIGLETARRARADGADVILTARDPERLEPRRGRGRRAGTAAFDAADPDAPRRFFDDLPTPSTTCWSPAGGPYYAPLAELDFAAGAAALDGHLLVPLQVARAGAGKVRPGGTLLFIGGTGGRRPGVGLALIARAHRGAPRARRNLAVELAPIRVNLIAAGLRRHAAVGIAARRRARRRGASSSARRSRSAGSSRRTTSPRSRST